MSYQTRKKSYPLVHGYTDNYAEHKRNVRRADRSDASDEKLRDVYRTGSDSELAIAKRIWEREFNADMLTVL